jgi:hypothetical protein
MARWEYCVVRSDAIRDTASFTIASASGWQGKEIVTDKNQGDLVHWDAVGRYIAQFGSEGWELVNVYAPSSGITLLWFKRRIPEGAPDTEGSGS